MVSVVSARKSIFSRPIFSTSVIGYMRRDFVFARLVERNEIRQRLGRNHHAGGVSRAWRARPSSRFATSMQSFTRRVVLHQVLQVGILLQRLVQRDVQLGGTIFAILSTSA